MDEVVYFFFLAVHFESLFMDVIVVIFFIEVLLTLLLHKLRWFMNESSMLMGFSQDFSRLFDM